VYRPALVRAPSPSAVPAACTSLSLWGWTLGGIVVLEYDTSPVGPYREYVRLGGLALTTTTAATSSNRRSVVLAGQYGAQLCVTTRQAQILCEQVWDLSAQRARIDFVSANNDDSEDDDDHSVSVRVNEDETGVSVRGWANAVRRGDEVDEQVGGGLSVSLSLLWTPKIKAIWTPVFLPAFVAAATTKTARSSSDTTATTPTRPNLAVNRLRVSGTPKLLGNKFDGASDAYLPLGLDIILQNASIEISEQVN
jgi:hypothetical protein